MLAGWISKQNLSFCCLQQTSHSQNQIQSQCEKMEEGSSNKTISKQVTATVLLFDIICFKSIQKSESVNNDQGKLHQEEIIVVNIHAPHIVSSKA